MFRRILVPIDGTTTCQQTYLYVKEVARKFNSEVILFNAQELVPNIAWVNDPISYSQPIVDFERMAKEILERGLACFAGESFTVKTHHCLGDPAHSILDTCESLECDTIIMGTHANTAIKRFLLGSVTDKVVHHAKVTVIIVR